MRGARIDEGDRGGLGAMRAELGGGGGAPFLYCVAARSSDGDGERDPENTDVLSSSSDQSSGSASRPGVRSRAVSRASVRMLVMESLSEGGGEGTGGGGLPLGGRRGGADTLGSTAFGGGALGGRPFDESPLNTLMSGLDPPALRGGGLTGGNRPAEGSAFVGSSR